MEGTEWMSAVGLLSLCDRESSIRVNKTENMFFGFFLLEEILRNNSMKRLKSIAPPTLNRLIMEEFLEKDYETRQGERSNQPLPEAQRRTCQAEGKMSVCLQSGAGVGILQSWGLW